MSDRVDFELKLGRAVTIFATDVDAPFDATEVASSALGAAHQGVGVLRPVLPWPRRATRALVTALAAVALVAAAGAFYLNRPAIIGTPPTTAPSPSPTVTASPAVQSASPSPSPPPATRVVCPRPSSATGAILGCSSDGSRVLIQKNRENLFIVNADGSETQLTDQLSGFNAIPGLDRPAGAVVSPDGTRVVFAGLTEPYQEGKNGCHNGGLFAVDAEGGPDELLWTSHIPQNGLINYPVFSPDGTQIAFLDGYCDWGHTLWVMNADGTGVHEIVRDLGAGWVHGLAWSQSGDRIAVSMTAMEGGASPIIVSPDGSRLTRGGSTFDFCWPGYQC
jgi:hypothetical protein